MTPPHLVTPAGSSVPLDGRLASGGEGEVFTLRGDSQQVAKVYHQQPGQQTVQKLMAMVALKSATLSKMTAWPTGLLCDARTFAVVGFTMPRVADSQPIQQLYNPVQRLKCFPRAGWDFQVCAAANLAAAFDEVHKAGCLVGDVNQSNALVSAKATVHLIDCDSFQVQANGRDYPCEVGVVHYTPPELQGKSFRGLVRAENHDRFGLSVLIYQLLFAGRHPYMGLHKDDASFEQLITGFRFSQGPAARSCGMEPPPHTPTFEDVPREMGTLFRRSFERGSEANGRPRAAEWLVALTRLGRELTTCAADGGHKYWRGARSCVWCRLAQRGGPEYYFGMAGGAGTFAVDEARLQEILRRLNSAQNGEQPWDRSRCVPASRPVGAPLPHDIAKLRADWKVAEDGLQVRARDRQLAEANEIRQAQAQEARRIEMIQAEYQERDDEIEEEMEAEYEAAKVEKRDRSSTKVVLSAALGFGVVLIPLGCVHRAFFVIGLFTACVFGLWLGVYNALSPAAAGRRRMAHLRRERAQARWEADEQIREAKRDTEQAALRARERTDEILRSHRHAAREREVAFRNRVESESAHRRRGLEEAEAALISLERSWAERGRQFQRQCQDAVSSVHVLVSECRALASQYQTELTRLTANAEAAARLRHLKLSLLAEADISRIGDGRKQILASHNIFTAADVEEYAIRAIKGFGDSLTVSLLSWREQVSREFRFDPKTGASPAEHGSLVVRFRSAQQRILADANQRLAVLDTLAPGYQADLQRLASQLQTAVARYEQAKADWSLMA